MTSDNANAIATATQLPRVPPRAHHQAPGSAVATNAESIPCPRCDSNNTKFCYYNNYNLSQPRHFCKSCRRYWTHGGTLRNVPVGGGTRKPTSSISTNSSSSSSANKRPRCSPAIVPPCSSSYAFYGHNGVSANGARTACSVGVKGASAPSHGAGCELGASLGSGFSSPLSGPGSNTVLALGGYGQGYVPVLDGIGFGFNNGVWPFPDADLVEGASYSGFRGPIVGPAGVDAWNVGGSLSNAAKDGEVGAGGLIDGEAFPWPELAISMPGQGLK